MNAAPASEHELLARAERLAGLTLAELAGEFGMPVPPHLRGHKGWVGDLVETALGATGASRPVPDFEHLGIELKTIPLDARGRVLESTHVCSVPLDPGQCAHWSDSVVRRKLARVLWVPVEGGADRPPRARRLGRPVLWSPTQAQETVLREDYEEHMELIQLGRLDEIDARLGTYLQVRPKAANGRALTASADAAGEPAATLPRGFYLRASFTGTLLDG